MGVGLGATVTCSFEDVVKARMESIGPHKLDFAGDLERQAEVVLCNVRQALHQLEVEDSGMITN